LDPHLLQLLARWNNFYVIAGSAAAALTGLQFVVIVLGAQAGMGSEDANRAFGTPTIVHFCAVLLVATLLSAPWPSLASAALVLGGFALAGFLYMLAVLRHTRRQKTYEPVLEDWIWHTILPVVAYAALAGAAVVLDRDPPSALFVVGASVLLLLFVGIHNAWDAVTYIAVMRRKRLESGSGSESSSQ
jgi:hypothetical protein